MSKNIAGLLIIFAGIVSLLSIIRRWTWVMNHPRIKFFFNLFGEKWASVLLLLIYIGLIFFGVLVLLGAFGDG
jgi:hypothetical protein